MRTAATQWIKLCQAMLLLLAVILLGCGGGSGSSTVAPGPLVVDQSPQGRLESVAAAIAGGTMLPQWARLTVSGWTADLEDGSPVNNLHLLIDGNPVLTTFQRVQRPDIAAQNPKWLNSGWTASFNIEDMAPGQHEITAMAVDSAGNVSTFVSGDRITVTANGLLDLGSGAVPPLLQSTVHQPLPEQFAWVGTAAAAYFRHTFVLGTQPLAATLYVAGPPDLQVFMNGQSVTGRQFAQSDFPRQVLVADPTMLLVPGSNVIAIAASSGDQQLAAKLIAGEPGANGAVLEMTTADWKGATAVPANWADPMFDDRSWSAVQLLGGIEDRVSEFTFNRDVDLIHWPGYDGISGFLAHIPVQATTFVAGTGAFTNQQSLTTNGTSGEFTVAIPQGNSGTSPDALLDFGNEITGRLRIVSDSDATVAVSVGYGESAEEATQQPYLGEFEVRVPPRATAYGRKSAFRYAHLRFMEGPATATFRAIEADGTYYPVAYQGSFFAPSTGNGSLLGGDQSAGIVNRIWATGAKTAHAAMQDQIWDAPKRDRGAWSGDLQVTALTAEEIFADPTPIRKTMNQLIADANYGTQHVNNIPGYSAFWIVAQADFCRHFGDLDYLRTIHDPLIALMRHMEQDLDANNVFSNAQQGFDFVDWSTDYFDDTAEARRATHFEYYRGFVEGAWLLRQSGDDADAVEFESLAQATRQAAQTLLLDPNTNTYGSRWQTNAMAVYSGIATAAQAQSIWNTVLSHAPELPVTPYYNYYALTAMAMVGHRKEALQWLALYWGGMVEEGATSFWEAYDPGWPKQNFHEFLQADSRTGYYVSLSHGWSSGVSAWLMEQVLGVQPTDAGFNRVLLRPYYGLVSGSVPTPHGAITVNYSVKNSGTTEYFDANITLPPGATADVAFPAARSDGTVLINGSKQPTNFDAANGYLFTLGAGQYEITTKSD